MFFLQILVVSQKIQIYPGMTEQGLGAWANGVLGHQLQCNGEDVV